MKSFLSTLATAFVCFLSVNTYAQHEVVKLWQTDSLLKTPESVLYDAKDKVLYVSNINGDASVKDGNGSIGKVGLDGKIINVNWVTGLDAPKGLGRYKNFMYAADISGVAEIDIAKGTIIRKIPIEGSVFLNDITVDSKGVVYVSDSRTNKVHRIENGVVSTYGENLKGANGVLAVGTDLYVLASGTLVKISADKKQTTIATGMDSGTDGLEMVKENEFLATSWSGILYYVTGDKVQTLFDTRSTKTNSADIGYDAVHKIVYVPTFARNSIMAYQLK